MKTRYVIGMAALQMTFLATQASAVVIGFDGGTATLEDGSTVVTDNINTVYPVMSYVEKGVLMQLNADTQEGVYVGNYYGADNAVIHAHWDAVVGTNLQSITFSMVDGSAFDFNYMDITSNTTCGGCSASGTEDSWVTASNGATMKLPSADWGSIQEPERLWLSDDFDNITSFTVTSKNAFCFGMDNFYINEEKDPLNLAVDDGLDFDAGECIPANSTDITYTVSYENTNQDSIEAVQISHTDGTWGGSSWTWNVGNVAAGATDSNQVTLPLGSLTPDTTFTNEFTLTSTSPNVPETTVVEETLVCPKTNTEPEAQCKDVELILDSNGQAELSPSQADNGSSDPDGDPITFNLSRTDFSCSDVGAQHAVTLTVTDDGGLSDSCVSNVTVVDNTAPTIDTNAPSTITPSDAPISFIATADDNCSAAVEITDYSCYGFTGNGKQHSKMQSCVVSVSGDTLTILDSGGVGDNITWTVRATDQSGNTTTAEGHVLVVNPGKERKK